MSKNPLCFLPSFPQSLKSAVNKEQFKVLNYFEHYPFAYYKFPILMRNLKFKHYNLI